MNILYAIPTYHCNLCCPHCHIRDNSETFNNQEFMDKLNNFDGKIILFGGEPTVHLDRMFNILESNKAHGKSKIRNLATNLMILNDELISIYKEMDFIGTSWNRNRFTPEQYSVWLSNCDKLEKENITAALLITITEDLMEWGVDRFMFTASQWNSKVLPKIRFEHYIGDDNTPEYYPRVDQWLSNLYQRWTLPIKVETVERLDSWYFNCDNIYTLLPNGKMINSCPNGLYVQKKVPNECLSCSNAVMCRPCRLQSCCSYPKTLNQLVKERDNNHVGIGTGLSS